MKVLVTIITILVLFLFIDMLGITFFGMPWDSYIQPKIDKILKWWLIAALILITAIVICFIILLV